MKIWEDRTREEAFLLNPSFCSPLLSATVNSYRQETSQDFPLILLFMILPIVLHKKTRQTLPPSTRTSMVFWLQENPDAKIFFYQRVTSLKPHTLETLQFSCKQDLLSVNGQGEIVDRLEKRLINRVKRTLSDEARECFMKSIFLGKWLASAGDVKTILALWGIKP